jgi:cation diffusion facilitator CzcD-associated flavoprotein CzcO
MDTTNDTDHENENKKIIIVGAGSTGAALAQGLKKVDRTPIDMCRDCS